MELPDFFKNFKINTYYKYSGYLFGIIFILSFIVEFKNVEILEIRNLSLWFIIGSMGAWFIDDISDRLINLVAYKHYQKDIIADYTFLILIGSSVIQIVMWYHILKYKLGII